MALLFSEGFDGYSGSATYFARAGYNNLGAFSLQSGQGRFGTFGALNGANFSSTGTPWWTYIQNPAVNDIGFAMWVKNSNFSWSDSTYLFRLTNAAANLNFVVAVDSGGRVMASNLSPNFAIATDMRTNNQNTLINTQDGAWHHIEGRFIASNTTNGLIKIWVDGALVLNYENVITINAQSTFANNSNVMGLNAAYFSMPNYCFGCFAASYHDDIVIWDGSGAEMNTATRLGPHRIRSLFPRANGTYKQFNGFSNTSGNWNTLTSINDDTSFAEANTNGLKDSYLFDVIPGNPTKIPAVSIRSHTRNPDIGDKKFSIFVRSGSTEVNANATIYTASFVGYTFSSNTANLLVYHSDPNGNISWTAGNLANAEIGIEVES